MTKNKAATPGLPGACRIILFLLIVLSFSITNAFAQNGRIQPKEYWGVEASKVIPGATYVKEGMNTSYPSFVRFDTRSNVSFTNFFPWLKQVMKIDPNVDFKLVKQDKDELGFTHYRYIQIYRQIPIDKSFYIVHVKENLVTSFNGLSLDVPKNLSTKANFNESQALQSALRYVGAAKYKWEDKYWQNNIKQRTGNPDATYFPKGELCFSVGNDNKTYQLSYKFDINSASPDKVQRVFVNAGSGVIINTVPLESNCTGASVNTIFNGNQNISTDKYTNTNFRLRDDCQSAGLRIRDWNSTTCTSSPVEIENTTNSWTTMNEQFGGSVLWALKGSYLYWSDIRGRDSYDNSNGNVEGYINAVFSSCGGCCPNTDNASMSFSGGTMKVGLGSAGTLANSWSTLDIIAHEFAHAVTGASANLTYSNESGALNESFSDIFGETTENYILEGNDWLMGDERTNGAIRSLSNPNANNDPDTYGGTNWFTGSGDNGGVHTNSGVQNFWFYLLTVGGSGTNDNGDAYNVSGIGMDKASAIAARNLINYLGSSSNYSDARTNAIQAAIDLYGACSNEVKQTTNAWYAVGVGAQFFDANAVETSNYNGRDVSCFNACDGAATVNVISGVLPVYSWSNGASTQSISGLCPGTYTVTVTNALGLGCAVTKSVVINNTPLLTATPAVTSNYNGYGVSCFGSSDGTASANAAGGTPPYSYSWSNGQTTNNVTGLSAGNYSVDVTDANGCTASGSITVTQPPPLTTTVDATSDYNGYDVRCHGGSDGVAEAYPTGGVAPYTYSWSDGQTTKIATGLSATTYTCTVTDANGCITFASTTLTEPPQLTINAGSNAIVYLGYPDSSCTILTATGLGGGVPPYVLTWSTGSHAASIDVCPTATTVYTATITDANNCSFSDQVTVCVIDVRCGNNLDKVVICHKTGSASNPNNTLCVALSGAKNHIAHGCQLAECGLVKVCNDGGLNLRTGFPIVDLYKDEVENGNVNMQAYPNPFSKATTIRFRISRTDNVVLKLVDVSGKILKVIYTGNVDANKWYEETIDGSIYSSGMYFLQLSTRKGNNSIQKLLLAK